MGWDVKAALVVLTGVLALAMAIRRWLTETRRSRLIQPNVFELPPVLGAFSIYTPDTEAYQNFLVGRENGIGNLSRLIQSNALVFVDGPSGVGKSTLLKLGVARQLLQTGTWLPVYVDVWGADWESGPRRALTDALQVALDRGLDEVARAALDLNGAVTDKNLIQVLGRLRSQCGRRPVLFFDQLDDYQSCHWQRFSEPANGTIISTQQLTRVNEFWREIHWLLKKRTVHAVFAIRSDASRGLNAFWFETPAFFPVYRLVASHVRTMIGHLAGETAVSEPENGFRQLVDSLAEELERSGQGQGVLPIQMRVVLSGLSTLHRLTPADLRKAGGVMGLEAAYLRRHLPRVPGGQAKVLPVLRRMVENELGPEAKAVSKTLAELAAECGSAPADVEPVLRELAREGVLRPGLDPGRGEVWQLYHDYLARAVLTLEREDHHWWVYLAEKAAVFDRSSGLEKWRALLPPGSLLRLLWEGLRGRLRFGPHRAFLAWSAPRLVLNVWILLALAGAGAIAFDQEQERGQALARSFDVVGDGLKPQELDALWGLANSSDIATAAALNDFLENSVNARRFWLHHWTIVPAIAGTSVKRREIVREVLSSKCYASSPEEDLVGACVVLVYNFETHHEKVTKFLAKSLDREQGSIALSQLANLVNGVDRVLLENFSEQLLLAIEEEEAGQVRADQLVNLYWGLDTVAQHLDPPSRLRVAERYLGILERRSAAGAVIYSHWGAGPGLVKLAARLAEAEATALAERAIRTLVIPKSHDTRDFYSNITDTAFYAAKTLTVLAERISTASAADLLRRIELAGEAQHGSASGTSENLTVARAILLTRAGRKINADLVNSLSQIFEGEIERTSGSWGGPHLPPAVMIRLGPYLGAEFFSTAAESVVTRIEKPDFDGSFIGRHSLAAGLAAFGEQVDVVLMRRAVEGIHRWMESEQKATPEDGLDQQIHDFRLQNAREALGYLAPHVTAAEAASAAPEMARAIIESEVKKVESRGLSALAERLRPADARALAEQILRGMQEIDGEGNGLSKLTALGESLEAATGVLGEDPALFREILRRTQHLARPPCAAAANLAAAENLRELANLLKWPTCRQDGSLIRRIAEILGTNPEIFKRSRTPGEARLTDFWRFVAWAEEQNGAKGRRLGLGRPVGSRT